MVGQDHWRRQLHEGDVIVERLWVELRKTHENES